MLVIGRKRKDFSKSSEIQRKRRAQRLVDRKGLRERREEERRERERNKTEIEIEREREKERQRKREKERK